MAQSELTDSPMGMLMLMRREPHPTRDPSSIILGSFFAALDSRWGTPNSPFDIRSSDDAEPKTCTSPGKIPILALTLLLWIDESFDIFDVLFDKLLIDRDANVTCEDWELKSETFLDRRIGESVDVFDVRHFDEQLGDCDNIVKFENWEFKSESRLIRGIWESVDDFDVGYFNTLGDRDCDDICTISDNF